MADPIHTNVNLDRVYFEARMTVVSPGSWEQRMQIFCIPYSKLPEVVRKKLLATTKVVEAGSLDSFVQNKRKENSNDKVFGVVSVNPLKINGLSSVEFMRIYQRSLSDILIHQYGSPELKVEQTTRSKGLKVSTPIGSTSTVLQVTEADSERIKRLLSPAAAAVPAELRPALSRVMIVELRLNRFKDELAMLINNTGSSLSPYDSMRLIWDLLSLKLLEKMGFSQRILAELGKQLLLHWEEVQMSIYEFSRNMLKGKIAEGRAELAQAIEQLDRLPKKLNPLLKNERNHESFLNQIGAIQLPLISLLKDISIVQDVLETKEYCLKLQQFFQNHIRQWCSCDLSIDNKRLLITQWLKERADVLQRYLPLLVPEKQVDSFSVILARVSEEIAAQNWLLVHQNLKALKVLLLAKVPLSISFTSTLAGASALERSVDIIDIPKENFRNWRCFDFVLGFLRIFELIVSDGKLFQIVSEATYKQFVENYRHMAILSNQSCDLETKWIDSWAIILQRQELPQLQQGLDQLKNSWKALQAIFEEIVQNSELEKSLNTLMTQIAKEEFSDLIHRYSQVGLSLMPYIDRWETEMKTLNTSIRSVQGCAFLMLMDPALPSLSLDDLRKQFLLLNRDILRLMHPVTSFFNAFSQLICFGSSSLAPQPKEEVLFKLNREKEFKLLLFQTDTQHFDDLNVQIEAVKRAGGSLTIEIDRAERIKDTFGANTKTRKIIQNLGELLRDWNIEFSIVTGKGDHKGLVINGIKITFPDHEEWRPGTAQSIENRLLHSVKGSSAAQKKDPE